MYLDHIVNVNIVKVYDNESVEPIYRSDFKDYLYTLSYENFYYPETNEYLYYKTYRPCNLRDIIIEMYYIDIGAILAVDIHFRSLFELLNVEFTHNSISIPLKYNGSRYEDVSRLMTGLSRFYTIHEYLFSELITYKLFSFELKHDFGYALLYIELESINFQTYDLTMSLIYDNDNSKLRILTHVAPSIN